MTTVAKNIIDRVGFFGTYMLVACIILFAGSCKKFLDEKPRSTDAIPSTLDDLQTMLDNQHVIMNSRSPAALSEFIADNYYLSLSDFSLVKQFIPIEGLNHIWAENAQPYTIAWNNPYQGPIYYSNIVQDQLEKISVSPGEAEKFNNLKGAALFHRAFTFWSLAQLYCKPYAPANFNEHGIVLKVTSSVSEKIDRATVKQTYERIINDLETAIDLLPTTSLIKTRPTKTAAYAALARVYLSIVDYDNAAKYADMALGLYSTLMDFDNLTGSPRLKTFNEEVIYHSVGDAVATLNSFSRIDTVLYQSYDTNDVRKKLFFIENPSGSRIYRFQGSYHGNNSPRHVFDGLTTGELYLIRAECAARKGNTAEAMADLNKLMKSRWKTGQFVDFTAVDANDALTSILTERRKELVFRGLRWSDLRRFNLENPGLEIKRQLDIEYKLPLNHPRSLMLIPWDEVNRSGIQQNPRQ